MSERMESLNDVLPLTPDRRGGSWQGQTRPMARKRLHIALVYNTFRADAVRREPARPRRHGRPADHDPPASPRPAQGRPHRHRPAAGRRPVRLPAPAPPPAARRRLQPVRRRRPRRPVRDAAGGRRAHDGLPHDRLAGPGPGPDALQVHVGQPARRRRHPHPAEHGHARNRPRRRSAQVAVPDHRAAQPGARRRRPRPQLGRALQEGAARQGPRDPARPTTSRRWRSASCPAASSTSASSAATACACCRWPRSTTRALPTDIPPIMSYAAKWMETSAEYQNTTRRAAPPTSSRSCAKRIGQVAAAGLPRGRRPGLRPRRHAPRRERQPVRAGGELQSAAWTRAWAWPARPRRPASPGRSSSK